jgi:hypothetical protein
MKERANKVTKQQRVERVLELIAMSYMTFQIVDICKKEWGVNRRSVERYLTICYRFLAKSLKDKDKDKIILEYDVLINKFEKLGNHRMALEYRKQRDKIIGIAVERRDITSNGETLFREQPLFLPICKECGQSDCICEK